MCIPHNCIFKGALEPCIRIVLIYFRNTLLPMLIVFFSLYRIKTFTPEEKTEPAPPVIPTAITVTDTDAEEHQTKKVEVEEAAKVEEAKPVEEAAPVKKAAPVKVELDEKKKENKVEKDTQHVDVIETKQELAPQEDISTVKHGLTPRRAPKFKQRQSKQFKSKPPKRGVIGFGDDIPGMDGLGTDITVICPWEAFSHLELHELAQFGII
ncbi:retinal cone rhodopsin-sensitive cGMP 3, 5 -cyclic phosphodiesterase subunit gamma [Pelobates cultripes]|uniref:Retinal cone rhodopsin-sensitive cGMP 3',5'-cyclic phosphodiesterase subunit gamma n=1 Tax=Pelobates cultripes TaxID=61616 RepID=A0AAD1ST55_PELCU|nr:retinal cone rhodopsin-sensitive cGMP 3, 5 -cyclic phosphodiesterase subunit gamma [Pelobates cultripes]